MAPGPSGLRCEHVRPLLDNSRDSHRFFSMAEQLAQGVAPEAAIHAVQVGCLTALRKPDGGVRGIVAGDMVRRLIARTIAQQMSDAVKQATSPFQCALSTRAGCECISHALQGLTELDHNATVLSIDGVGAFDLISRSAMLQGLRDVSPAALPFVKQFYGSPSRYLWEDIKVQIKAKAGSRETHSCPRYLLRGSVESCAAAVATWRNCLRLLG